MDGHAYDGVSVPVFVRMRVRMPARMRVRMRVGMHHTPHKAHAARTHTHTPHTIQHNIYHISSKDPKARRALREAQRTQRQFDEAQQTQRVLHETHFGLAGSPWGLDF